MARFREYTPARRHAMQALMWLIFAGTYGAVVMLAHARTQALRVSLTANLKDGDLLYRLPAGWIAERREKGGVIKITAIEPRLTDRTHRIVQIDEFLQESGALSATEVMTKISERPIHAHPFAFKNLGQGVSWETPRGIVENGEEREMILPGLYACVVAPRLKHSRELAVIIIWLKGPLNFGPSSLRLLRSIADSVALAPNDASARAVSPGGGERVAGS